MKKLIILCCTFTVLFRMLTAFPVCAQGMIFPKKEITVSSESETSSEPESNIGSEAEPLSSGLTMQIGEVTAKPGETVEIPVKLTKNPDGLSYFKAVIQADAAVSFCAPMIGGYLREQANDIVYDISGNELTVIWGSGNGKEILSSSEDTPLVKTADFPYTETNDAFFTLVVEIPEKARPDTVYTIAFAQDTFEALDGKKNGISGHAESGKITVIEPAGNALGDDEKEKSDETPNLLAWVLIFAAGVFGGFGIAFASSEAKRKKEARKSGKIAKNIDNFKKRLNETENLAQSLQERMEFSEKGTMGNLQQNFQSLQEKYNALTEQIGNLRTAAQNLETMSVLPSSRNDTALREQLAEISSENKELKQKMQIQQNQIATLTAQNQDILKQNSSLQNQLKVLQEQEKAVQEMTVPESVRTVANVKVRPVHTETPMETAPEPEKVAQPQKEKMISENDALIKQLEREKGQFSSSGIPVYSLSELKRKIMKLEQDETTTYLYEWPDNQVKNCRHPDASERQGPIMIMEITPEEKYIYPVCDERNFHFSAAQAKYFEYDNAGITENTFIQPCIFYHDKRTNIKGRIWTETDNLIQEETCSQL